MKILALVGSPRRQGNTAILVDEILLGAKARGHVTEKIRLYDYEIMPCLDCRRCKRSEEDFTCPLKDGMQEIYPKLTDADVIIFATPIYWYGPTGMMKLLIDRLRPFIASKRLVGKKGIIVAPSEEGADCCQPLLEMFQMSFAYLGMEPGGKILAKAYERGEIKNDAKELLSAYKLGELI